MEGCPVTAACLESLSGIVSTKLNCIGKIASPGYQLWPGNSNYYTCFTSLINVKITVVRRLSQIWEILYCGKCLCPLPPFHLLVWFVTSPFAVAADLHSLLYLNLSRCCLTDGGCEKFSSEFIFLWLIYLLLSFNLAYLFRVVIHWFHSDHDILKLNFTCLHHLPFVCRFAELESAEFGIQWDHRCHSCAPER